MDLTKATISSKEAPIETDPKRLIPYLCNNFYRLGWVSGTGGGMSIKISNKIYIAPSGVQKEMMRPEDIFVIDAVGEIIEKPLNCNLSMSECTPLFLNAYRMRNAGAVIHSHSINSNLVTVITPGTEFRITRQEMIKGIRKGSALVSHRNDETLIVPIIENTCYERELTEKMADAIRKYPDTNAVLVRRHGVYVWGPSWQGAKTMAECYEYLFEIAVEMRKLNMRYD
ncbi:methylthioribulose-1-phosphate dehydratase [Tetranychus urticae]|uniref:Probable methylthioribulose-1-phosphate dehydratase n=1 Tax=Tetranychus urticae TaxID=32264 RepID=T1K0X4_TETUR|nr:methylthioribulose-1-phosphate dehydratase [Tetranychus urticae]